jgi:hypothetical protein
MQFSISILPIVVISYTISSLSGFAKTDAAVVAGNAIDVLLL